MKLVQVKERCILLWPLTFPGGDQRRGGPGYVVDLDAPCEAAFIAQQEFKLEPAPKGAVVSAIAHPVATRLIAAERSKEAGDLEVRPRAPAAAKVVA